jgi:hypothetical protein
MGYYNWTLRQKAKVAIPVVLAAAFALQNVACQRSTAVTVVNQSDVEVRFAETVKRCDELDPASLPRSYWNLLPPLSEKTVLAYELSRCFVAQDLSRSAIATTEFHENSVYVVNVYGGSLDISTEVGEPEDHSRFVLITAAAGVPFFFGMVAAIFIALRFFYRYYVRGDKTAELR